MLPHLKHQIAQAGLGILQPNAWLDAVNKLLDQQALDDVQLAKAYAKALLNDKNFVKHEKAMFTEGDPLNQPSHVPAYAADVGRIQSQPQFSELSENDREAVINAITEKSPYKPNERLMRMKRDSVERH